MAEATSIRRILPILDRGGAKPSPIQILDPRKVGSHPKNFGQQRGTISTAASSRSQPSWSQDSKGRRLPISKSQIVRRDSCRLATRSPTQSRKIHINNPDFPLLTKHQVEFKALRNPSPTSLSRFSLTDSDKQKSGGHL